MRYFMRLFAVSFAALLSAVAFVGQVIANAIPEYQPSASESIEADRISRTPVVITGQRSRVLAFVERAKTHVDFSAGHFDPGRLAA